MATTPPPQPTRCLDPTLAFRRAAPPSSHVPPLVPVCSSSFFSVSGATPRVAAEEAGNGEPASPHAPFVVFLMLAAASVDNPTNLCWVAGCESSSAAGDQSISYYLAGSAYYIGCYVATVAMAFYIWLGQQHPSLPCL